jgi:hypothetical protein
MDFRNFFLNKAEEQSPRRDVSLISIYEQIKGITREDWSDFETALADINLPQHISELYYADAGDLSEMDQLTNEGTEFGEEFSSSLADVFCDWIKNDVSLERPKRTPPSIAKLIQHCDAYLTFNYTTTLEDHFGVPDAKILHIHGTAYSSSSPYFGCPSEIDAADQGGNYSITATVREAAHKQLIEYLTKHPRLDLVHNLLSNSSTLKTVSSYGFSFGDPDHDYIRAVLSHTDAHTTWINYCHTPNGELPEDTDIAETCKDILSELDFPGTIQFRVA